MRKSAVAFRFSVDRFFECFPKVYFWTITWKSVMPDFRYPLLFRQFMTELCHRHGGLLYGLRVIEVHPGGHGLHYHLIVNLRMGIRLVRAIGKKYGIGFCWVTQCYKKEDAYYLGKYLSKDSELSPGMRRWGTIGGFTPSRVRDLHVDSTFHRNMGKVFGGKKASCPETTWVWRNSSIYGPVGSWPDPTHVYRGDPVWVKCCCPVCSNNRNLKGRSGTYLLDRGLKRKLAPFSVRARCPRFKRPVDYLTETYSAAGY